MPKENFHKGERDDEAPSGAEGCALLGEPEVEKFFNELTPAAVESMIAFDVAYLDKVRYLRPMMQGEMGKLWDKLNDEARYALRRGVVPPEQCKDILRRLEDFTFAVEELDSLLPQEKKKSGVSE